MPATDAMPSRLNEMPTWLISQTALHAHRLLAQALAAMSSNGYQYRLLAALEEFGPACQAALGRRTGIDRSDVVAALNDLAKRGLVNRSADPADRRGNVITVTAAGTDWFQQLDSAVAEVQDMLLAPLARRAPAAHPAAEPDTVTRQQSMSSA